MTVVNAELTAAADTLRTRWTHLSLHNGDPGTTGANEITGGGYTRQPAGWAATVNGEAAVSADVAFIGPAGQTVTHLGVWSAASGGAFRAGAALTGDGALNAAGEYLIKTGTKLRVRNPA